MSELELGRSKLQQALLEVSKNYLENLELAPEEDISFSPKLERKMSHLIRSQRKSCRHCFNTPCKKAIAACLAIIIFAGAIMGCNKIREPIVEFFTEVYETFTEFFFGAEDKEAASQVIEEVHMPTYVPDGYELMERPTLTGEDFELKTVWQKSDGTKLHFYQHLLTAKITLDTENAEKIEINDEIKISIVNKGNESYIFWNTAKYSYSLMASDLSEEKIIKIVKSLK